MKLSWNLVFTASALSFHGGATSVSAGILRGTEDLEDEDMMPSVDVGGGVPKLNKQVELLLAHEEIRNTLAGWHRHVDATTWGGDREAQEEDFRAYMEKHLTEDFVFNNTMHSGEPIAYDVGRDEWVEVELGNLFPEAKVNAIVGSPHITVDLENGTADLYYERTLYLERGLAPFSFALMRGNSKWRKEYDIDAGNSTDVAVGKSGGEDHGMWKMASMHYLQYNRE